MQLGDAVGVGVGVGDAHDFVAERVQLLRRPILGHQKRRSRKRINEPGYGDVGIWGMVDAQTEGRISRRDKIDVEFPAVYLSQGHAAGGGAIDGDEELIPARRRSGTRAKTSGNQTVRIPQPGGGDVKSYSVGSTASEHRGTIKRKNAHAFEGKSGAVKQVDREIIGVLSRAPTGAPHCHLRVITDPGDIGRVMLDRI